MRIIDLDHNHLNFRERNKKNYINQSTVLQPLQLLASIKENFFSFPFFLSYSKNDCSLSRHQRRFTFFFLMEESLPLNILLSSTYVWCISFLSMNANKMFGAPSHPQRQFCVCLLRNRVEQKPHHHEPSVQNQRQTFLLLKPSCQPVD